MFIEFGILEISGVRSANSCHLLKELGFVNTYNLIGGIVDWKGETIN